MNVKNRLIYAGLVIMLILVLFPLLWMFITSFKTDSQITVGRSLFIPVPFVIDNYVRLLAKTKFLYWYRNTLIVTFSSSVVSVFIGLLAAYGLTRYKFFGSRLLASGTLITYLIPRTILFIPLSMVMIKLGLRNSIFSLILTYPTFTAPFCAWLLIGFLKTIPREIDDAASIDGCTPLQVLFRVILPIASPGVIAAFIFSFNMSWMEFIYALVFISSDRLKTLTVGIADLMVSDVYLWGQIMAAGVLSSIPIVVIFILAQRHFIQGISLGAVKE